MPDASMRIIEDFKKFALRGNVVDLAIGFTVGAAFTTVARSLVDDVIMPPIGLLIGNVDFSKLYVLLRAGTAAPPPYATLADAQAAGAVTLNYGAFINTLITLLIVALAMFAIIRLIASLDRRLERMVEHQPKPPAEPENKKCPHCRMTIPYRASRCGFCTSDISTTEGAGL